MMGILKHAANQVIPPLLKRWLRYFPWHEGKARVWHHHCWRPHLFTARTRFGALIEGNTEETFHRYLYYFGTWEPNLTGYVQGRLRPGDLFLDVGANVGYYSLLGSSLVGSEGQVVAVEASPITFDQLTANLRRNRVRNVRALCMAATATRCTVLLHHSNEDHMLSSIVDGVVAGDEKTCEVPGAPLPDMLEPGELERVALIKIDVEGAESLVLDGLLPAIHRCRDDVELVVEVAPDRLARQGISPNDLVRRLERHGFLAYALENDYGPLAYVTHRTLARPVRLDPGRPLVDATDVVFSRRAQDSL
jgi:FkbM family methyltransferase